MQYETLLCERDESILKISFSRPEKRNAFNMQMIKDICKATEDASKDDKIRCVILTGVGKGFCAGADLSENGDNEWTDTEDALVRGYKPSLLNIINMPKPVIAAVNGAAAGIGSAYAMACDLTIMADDAYILQAFSNIGLIPDGGTNWLLANTIGYKNAYQIAIEGDRISASRCLELGLINKVVKNEQLLIEAQNWAKRLVERSPQSLSYTKKVMRKALNSTYEEIYDLEANIQNDLVGSPDNQEGIRAFLDKREPEFKN